MSPCGTGSQSLSLLACLPTVAGRPPIGLSLFNTPSSPPNNASSFAILDDSDPLTRIVAAAIVGEPGCELKRLTLLIQKDCYGIGKDSLWPLNNADIDQAWKKGLSKRRGEGVNGVGMFPGEQLGADGKLRPVDSLFYCAARNYFFSPPCPRCGKTLSLCTDDHLLRDAGLAPYRGSLKRYLYCGDCQSPAPDHFYVPARRGDDPSGLTNLEGLIDAFGGLGRKEPLAGAFPCGRCPEHDACYGDGHAARTRIVPFSFFPFHLLTFDSLTLPALDFLPLLSGATIDDLKRRAAHGDRARIQRLENLQREGRLSVSLVPDHDQRSFPEILYLKLTFLDDLLGQHFSGVNSARDPEAQLSIDRVWVELAGVGGLLPSFWNFTTRNLDIVRPSSVESLFFGQADGLLFHAGLLWFYALLVNGGQESRELMAALSEGLRDDEGGAELPTAPWCAPEQIFWSPAGKRIDERWLPLWRRVLGLGAGLMRGTLRDGGSWSREDFFRELKTVRAEIREAMFTSLPAAPEESPGVTPSVPDAAIHEALRAVLAKWRASAPPPAAEPISSPPVPPSETETVILSPAAIVPPVPPVRDEEEWTETVVLSTRIMAPSPVSPAPVRDVELLETVVLSPGGRRSEPATPAVTKRDDAAIPETVIITPSARPAPNGGAPPVAPATAGTEQGAAVDGDVPETVILQPQQPRARGKGWKD